MTDEYVSNPRLALLAEELRIFNENLIAMNLPDWVRLFRMREFANASKQITGFTLPPVEQVEDEVSGYRFRVLLAGKSLGYFETQTKAHEAYMQAHIQRYGMKSEYHPDHQPDTSHLLNKLPPGIQLATNGSFRASITVKEEKRQLGTFETLSEAVEAYQAAYIQHRGKASRFHTEQAAA